MANKYNGQSTIEDYWVNHGYTTDLRFASNAVQAVSGKPPADTAYRGGLVKAFPSNQNAAVTFNAQMHHGYDASKDIDFHIHYVLSQSGAGAGAENIKFDFTYSWADINGTFPTETTVSITHDVQNQVADMHYLLDIADVLVANRGAGMPAGGVSSMLICSLERDVSVANDYAGDVYFIEGDFHWIGNAPGSREEYIK